MGFAAAAPFVFKSLTCPLAGVTADLHRRNILSTKTVRRVFYTTGIASSHWLIFSRRMNVIKEKRKKCLSKRKTHIKEKMLENLTAGFFFSSQYFDNF